MPDAPQPPREIDVTVSKTGGLTIFQAVATVGATLGVGSALVFIVVPKMQDASERQSTFLQDKFIGTLEANAVKQTELIIETRTLGGKVDKLVDATDETNDILRPLSKKLSTFAKQVEVERAADVAEEGAKP